MNQKLRNSGIDIIGEVPWGTHFCQFYQTKEDLMDVLIPYFKAGLENNEFCMWVTSQPLDVEDAKKALRRAFPDLDAYIEKGQIEIIPYTQWYVKEGIFDSNRVLNGWVEKLNQALANGYNGLRLTGNTFWLEKEDWNDFVDYEEEVDRVLGNYQMIALCTYCLDKCNAKEIIDVVVNHQFALIKREGKWEQIESSKRREAEETAILQSIERKRAEQERERTVEALQKSEEQYRTLFSTMDEGFCIIEMLFDENEKPIDYIFIEANPAFEKQTGLNNAVGKRIRELIPANEEYWYEIYGKVALTGESVRFENRVEALHRWYEVYAFRIDQPESRKVAILFSDITERKRVEEQIRRQAEELETVMETTPVAIWIGHDPQSHNITGNRMANKFYEAEVGENVSANVTSVRRFFYEGRELTADELPMQEAALKDIDVRNVELDVLLPSGKWRVILGSASPLHDADGHVRGSIGAFIDITMRKRAEEALLESEKRYRMLFDKSMDAIILTDPRGVGIVLSANPAACRMLGWTEEELILKGLDEIFDVKNPAISTLLDEHIPSGSAKSQINYRRKDGTILTGEVSSTFFIDRNGEPRTVSIIRDITERKLAEKALQESEAKYRDVFETVQEVFYIDRLIYDEEGNVIDWIFEDLNPAGFELLGLKDIDDAKGKRGSEVLGHKAASFYLPMIEKARRSSKAVTFQYHSPYVDKEFLTSYIVRGDRLISAQMDATELKQVEEALRESEQRFRLALRNAPVSVAAQDRDLRYIGPTTSERPGRRTLSAI